MIKKWFVGLFLMLSCLSFAFAQTVKKQNEAQWEFLEVSEVTDCGTSGDRRECRTYNYPTSAVKFSGQASLEWMRVSGWELVGVVSYEQYPNSLYFKRQYDKTRTEKEIEWLKKEFDKESKGLKETKPASVLTDLDNIETKQNLEQFNISEETKWRASLEQIKNLPLKIINVKSDSLYNQRTWVGAEVVLDATSVLLKDGNKYRSSDADQYFRESAKQIFEALGQQITLRDVNSHAQLISRGSFKPSPIGAFYFSTAGVSLKISVIVNYKGQQIIVAQGEIWSNNAVMT